MASSKVLPCTFVKRGWEPIGEVHECTITNVDFKTQGEVVDNATEAIPSGIAFDDVKVLCILHTICHYLPKNIDKVFRNLEIGLESDYAR